MPAKAKSVVKKSGAKKTYRVGATSKVVTTKQSQSTMDYTMVLQYMIAIVVAILMLILLVVG